MSNYSDQWKKDAKFRQVSYDEFVTIPFSKGTFMQKVDGMLGTFVFSQNNKSFFQTTTGKEIADIPVIIEYEKLLTKMGVSEAKIPGELTAEKNGKILPLNEIQSIVKRSREEQNKDLIHHYPVDVISLNNSKVSFSQALRFISKSFKSQKHITLPKIVSGDLNDFRKLFSETMQPGFDGVIAREIAGKNYKIKYVNTVDLVIIGAGNLTYPAWLKKQISYLLTAFIDKDGNYRSSSKVGTGFTEKQRADFYDYITKNTLYMNRNEFFIKPEKIIEIKYFRTRITDTPIYMYAGKQYMNLGMKKSVTFSHPSFVRMRPDKVPNKLNARLEQIPDFKG